MNNRQWRNLMARIIPLIAIAGLVCGTIASADTAPDPTSNAQQWMKQCMDKMKQSNNGMAQADMEKSCRDQLKQKVASPDQGNEPVVPGH
jgi:hypothetical protein